MYSGDFENAFSGPLVPTSCLAPVTLPSLAAAGSSGLADGMDHQSQLKLLSWNLLASPYVRPQRESESEGLARAREQINYVAQHPADIIGLQEFWHASERLVGLWEDYAKRRRGGGSSLKFDVSAHARARAVGMCRSALSLSLSL